MSTVINPEKEKIEIFQKVTAMGNVTTGMIDCLLIGDKNYITYVYDSGDIVVLSLDSASYYGLGEFKHYTVSFGEYCPEGFDEPEEGKDPKPCWMMNHSQYFAQADRDQAIKCFVGRLKDENRMYAYREVPGEKLEVIRVKEQKVLIRESHYDYLDEMLDPFWKQVFNKTANESFCGGIVSAHGDKCYSYRDKWDKAGIPFLHGALLFLLSYTSELGDTPKHETQQWVIDNYHRYYLRILRAEMEVLKNVYGVEKRMPLEVFKRDPGETPIGVTEWTLYANGIPFRMVQGDTENDAVKTYLEITKEDRVKFAKKLTDERRRPF